MGVQQAGLTKSARRGEPNRNTIGRRALQTLQLGPPVDQLLRSDRTLVVERVRRTSVYGFSGQHLSFVRPRGFEPPLELSPTWPSILNRVGGFKWSSQRSSERSCDGQEKAGSDRAGRSPMRSQGRPPAWRREHRVRFWAAVARGLSSDEVRCDPAGERIGHAGARVCARTDLQSGTRIHVFHLAL